MPLILQEFGGDTHLTLINSHNSGLNPEPEVKHEKRTNDQSARNVMNRKRVNHVKVIDLQHIIPPHC